MMLPRIGLARSMTVLMVVLTVAACGGSGNASSNGNGLPYGGAGSTAGSSASAGAAASQAVAGASATLGLTAAPPSGGSSDCAPGLTSGHAKYTLSGYEAWHFCGPATATVTLGGTTVNITSGSCTVPATGMFSVSIGTELFGSPPDSVSPDYLNILIMAADGKTDPGGVVAHKGWLLVGATIAFASGRHSGTFSGKTINPGTTVHGSFNCG